MNSSRFGTTRKWVGFDPDDTLHHFRLASKQAAEAVFLRLQNIHNIPQAQLNSTYREILKRSQSNRLLGRQVVERISRRALSVPVKRLPGRPSRRRGDAGQGVRHGFGGESKVQGRSRRTAWGSEATGQSAGRHYGRTSRRSRSGRCSDWVCQDMWDLLVTSSRERTSKTDRLFHRALEQMACAPNGLIYIGDSLERDVLPGSGAWHRGLSPG